MTNDIVDNVTSGRLHWSIVDNVGVAAFGTSLLLHEVVQNTMVGTRFPIAGETNTATSAEGFLAWHERYSPIRAKSLRDLDKLLSWGENWNGYNASAPNPDAVRKGRFWLNELFYDALLNLWPWIAPNVTAGANGEVIFEWWKGQKSLTIFVEPDSVEYIKASGSGFDPEMFDGDASPSDARSALWAWLTN